MKYTDEEMTEAALLLAHADTSKAVPAELETTILERGRTVAAEMRFSTTKAGVIEVEAPPAPVVPITRASRLGATMGWFAAAACFAFATYEWRTRAVESTHAASQPAAPNRLVDSSGATVAELTLEGDGGLVKVVHLPAKPGQRYQLWTTTSDAAHATAVGSFACEPPGCDGRELALAAGGPRPTWAWITVANGAEAGRPTDSAAIMGSGGLAGGNVPR